MKINELMEKKNISKYALSKTSDIPYTTVSDICNGKTQLEKSTAETIYKLSKALGISMEDLLEPNLVTRPNFEIFKSHICHQLKRMGDIEFIVDTLKSNTIRKYFEWEWYLESLYLLAMVDYVSRINSLPLCTDYNDIRCCKLQETVYPAGVIATGIVIGKDKAKAQSHREAIPEFMRFNIVESEVRDVI